MLDDYFQKMAQKNLLFTVLFKPLDNLKVLAMYNVESIFISTKEQQTILSADSNYSPAMQVKINQRLETIRQRHMQNATQAIHPQITALITQDTACETKTSSPQAERFTHPDLQSCKLQCPEYFQTICEQFYSANHLLYQAYRLANYLGDKSPIKISQLRDRAESIIKRDITYKQNIKYLHLVVFYCHSFGISIKADLLKYLTPILACNSFSARDTLETLNYLVGNKICPEIHATFREKADEIVREELASLSHFNASYFDLHDFISVLQEYTKLCSQLDYNPSLQNHKIIKEYLDSLARRNLTWYGDSFIILVNTLISTKFPIFGNDEHESLFLKLLGKVKINLSGYYTYQPRYVIELLESLITRVNKLAKLQNPQEENLAKTAPSISKKTEETVIVLFQKNKHQMQKYIEGLARLIGIYIKNREFIGNPPTILTETFLNYIVLLQKEDPRNKKLRVYLEQAKQLSLTPEQRQSIGLASSSEPTFDEKTHKADESNLLLTSFRQSQTKFLALLPQNRQTQIQQFLPQDGKSSVATQSQFSISQFLQLNYWVTYNLSPAQGAFIPARTFLRNYLSILYAQQRLDAPFTMPLMQELQTSIQQKNTARIFFIAIRYPQLVEALDEKSLASIHEPHLRLFLSQLISPVRLITRMMQTLEAELQSRFCFFHQDRKRVKIAALKELLNRIIKSPLPPTPEELNGWLREIEQLHLEIRAGINSRTTHLVKQLPFCHTAPHHTATTQAAVDCSA